MTDLNPEGLEKAAEAVLADSNSLATSAARRFARAAVAAYLGHVQPVVDEYEIAKAIRASLMAGMMPDDWERISQSEQNQYMDAAKVAIATVLHRGNQ